MSRIIFNSPLEQVTIDRLPWKWMPTLYLFKGLSYAVLLFTSLVMLKRLGYQNSEITFYIGCTMLPWMFRPVLSIFVHKGYFNKLWILATEMINVICIAAIGYTITQQSWTNYTVLLYVILMGSNVFHDIASDKYTLTSIRCQQVSLLRIFKRLVYRLALLIAVGIVCMVAGNLEVVTRLIRASWSTAYYLLSAFLFVLSIWHVCLLPRFTRSYRERDILLSDMFYACLNTSADLIRTPSSWPGVLFLVCYLLPTNLLLPVSMLFQLDLGSSGGLGLSPQEFGYAYGTVGVFGLLTGDILGIWLVHRYGLKKLLLLMALAILVPSLVFIHLSFALPNNFTWICWCSFIQQLCYGFGSYAYLHFLVYYSEVKRFSTFMLCVALAAVAMAIPFILSGTLQMALGYRRFFMLTALCGVATLTATLLVMSVYRKETF